MAPNKFWGRKLKASQGGAATLRGLTGSALAWHTQDTCSLPGCFSKSCDLLPAFIPCNTWSSCVTALIV